MRFTVLGLAVALAVTAPGAAHAQAISPLQAAGIAQAVLGIAYGVMFPAPQCGPHDAIPRPYQPTPSYNPPPPNPDQFDRLDRHTSTDQPASLDEDDDDKPLKPLPPPPSASSEQPQTRPDEMGPDDRYDSDQTASGRARDSDESDGQPVMREADSQPAPARRKHRRTRSVQRGEQTQNSGQVAEIPSISQGTQRSGALTPEQ